MTFLTAADIDRLIGWADDILGWTAEDAALLAKLQQMQREAAQRAEINRHPI